MCSTRVKSLWYSCALVAIVVAVLSHRISFAQATRSPGRQASPRSGAPGASNAPAATKAEAGSLDKPLDLARAAKEKFQSIRDYTCMFIKQERIGGQLQPEEYMVMKARVRPFSVYLKWQKPFEGREAIYVHGQYDGKLMVHSTGVEKVVGGTVALNPKGETAMENSRHAITEAGIGNLVDQLVSRWEAERKLGQTKVELRDVKVDGRPCVCVKTQHPNDPRQYAYHRSRVFFDKEHWLPIRFEGYDWPKRGSAPDGDLVEVYTYRDLMFNVSLTATDFSIDNPNYSFGRF
jgi:outer membrane lipoprotein-sorting protein